MKARKRKATLTEPTNSNGSPKPTATPSVADLVVKEMTNPSQLPPELKLNASEREQWSKQLGLVDQLRLAQSDAVDHALNQITLIHNELNNQRAKLRQLGESFGMSRGLDFKSYSFDIDKLEFVERQPTA
jgi:hypothetical protein